MDLPNAETFKNRIIRRAEDVSGKIGNRLLWNNLNFHIHGGDKLAVIGPNGSGKTTLIKKIINEEAGVTLSPSVKIGYFSQNLTILDKEKSVLENIQRSEERRVGKECRSRRSREY